MKKANALSRTAFLVLLAAIVLSVVPPVAASHTSQLAPANTLDDATIFAILMK